MTCGEYVKRLDELLRHMAFELDAMGTVSVEARMGNRGKREFIQALRLIEVFPETLVAAAALDAIRLGAISFDAVKLRTQTRKPRSRPLSLSARRERQDNLGRRL
jgi:hypothetical protein